MVHSYAPNLALQFFLSPWKTGKGMRGSEVLKKSLSTTRRLSSATFTLHWRTSTLRGTIVSEDVLTVTLSNLHRISISHFAQRDGENILGHLHVVLEHSDSSWCYCVRGCSHRHAEQFASHEFLTLSSTRQRYCRRTLSENLGTTGAQLCLKARATLRLLVFETGEGRRERHVKNQQLCATFRWSTEICLVVCPTL